MGQATLFLMVGLPGSGKTTRAKELERETGAIRFTPDEWHLFLFGGTISTPPRSTSSTTSATTRWRR